MRSSHKILSASVLLSSLIALASWSPNVVRAAADVATAEPVIETITGELVDTGCYIAGGASGTDHASCGGECLASGVPAGVVPAGKGKDGMLFLLTNPRVVSKYVGQTIKIEGVVHADVHGVDVKKLSVKDGEGWKDIALKDAHHGTPEAEEHHHDGK